MHRGGKLPENPLLINSLARTRTNKTRRAIRRHDQHRRVRIMGLHHRRQTISHRSARRHHYRHRAALHPSHTQSQECGAALINTHVDTQIRAGCQRQRQRRIPRPRAHHNISHMSGQFCSDHLGNTGGVLERGLGRGHGHHFNCGGVGIKAADACCASCVLAAEEKPRHPTYISALKYRSILQQTSGDIVAKLLKGDITPDRAE